MSPATRRLLWAVSVISGIAFLLALSLVAATGIQTSHAQEEPNTIKARLEALRNELEAGNIMLGFQFMVPISEEENYWLFGASNAEPVLEIEAIEDDHFCFSQSGQQAVLIRCVPYTNIASFDYLSN